VGCTWEGDQHGLSYEKFKQVEEELNVACASASISTGYEFPFFRESTAYRTSRIARALPLYTARSNYRYTWGLTR